MWTVVKILYFFLAHCSPQVLQTTQASSVAADLRICEIFNRYYGELFQRSKLPDSGESSHDARNLYAIMKVSLYRQWKCLLHKLFSHFDYFWNSSWQNLRVVRSSCWGSPQRHGQQFWEAIQSLPGGAKGTGIFADQVSPRHRRNNEKAIVLAKCWLAD